MRPSGSADGRPADLPPAITSDPLRSTASHQLSRITSHQMTTATPFQLFSQLTSFGCQSVSAGGHNLSIHPAERRDDRVGRGIGCAGLPDSRVWCRDERWFTGDQLARPDVRCADDDVLSALSSTPDELSPHKGRIILTVGEVRANDLSSMDSVFEFVL